VRLCGASQNNLTENLDKLKTSCPVIIVGYRRKYNCVQRACLDSVSVLNSVQECPEVSTYLCYNAKMNGGGDKTYCRRVTNPDIHRS
jgi:hypothetical protein